MTRMLTKITRKREKRKDEGRRKIFQALPARMTVGIKWRYGGRWG